CNRVLVGAQAAVPCRCRSGGGKCHSNSAAKQGMAHGAVRSQARDNVGADDTVDDPVCGGQHQLRISVWLTEPWCDAEGVQQEIGSEGERNVHDESCEYCADTPQSVLRRLSHRSCPSAIGYKWY